MDTRSAKSDRDRPSDPRCPNAKAIWRVDFSLALFNQSGKYQIGKEIIERHRALIDSVWYWRWRSADVPRGLAARLIGRAEKLEHDWALRRNNAAPVSRSGEYRWLHLDPLTVCHRRPVERDVVLVHDLGPLTNPELFPPGIGAAYDLAFRIVKESGAHIVCVSEDTRLKFIEHFGTPRSSEVIYPPITPRLTEGELTRPQDVGERFILTVGAFGARKNQAQCIRAFALSGLHEEGVEYVLCGSREPGFEQVLAEADATPGVRILSFVSDAELRWLYANALGFVLASRLEGFGMPVAEAMAFGLPPIISRNSVLEEVAGETGLTVSPDSLTEISQAMRRALSMDIAERNRRQTQMRTRLASFSEEAFHDAWQALLAHQDLRAPGKTTIRNPERV